MIKGYKQKANFFPKLSCLLVAFLLAAGMGLTTAQAANVHSFSATLLSDNLSKEIGCLARLTYGNVDELLMGEVSKIQRYNTTSREISTFADFNGPYGRFGKTLGMFTNGNMITVTPFAQGQGCRLQMFGVDENGKVIYSGTNNFEWSHSDHDRSDYGYCGISYRTGRQFLGYGSLHSRSDYPPSEEGQPMKGLVMEYGNPTPDHWDSWTNQLCIPASKPHDTIGLIARSFVALDNGHVLIGAASTDGRTYFPVIESRNWDGSTPPNPDRRGPQKQGYWYLAQHPDGGNLYVPGHRKLVDPYVNKGEFNDFIFLISGSNQVLYSFRSNPTNFLVARVFHNEGGNWVEQGALPGGKADMSIHMPTRLPVLACNGDAMHFYQVARDKNNLPALYRVATAGPGGSWEVYAQHYKDEVYFYTEGRMFQLK
jgi:hypothetical protein